MVLEKEVHSGHRARLLDLVYKNGLANLSEVQALEYILTLAIPRKDTNILAHNLLEEFGSLPAVLDADINTLQKVKGIGERSAVIIRTLKDISTFYEESKLKHYKKLTSIGELQDYVQKALKYDDVEKMLIFALSKNDTVLGMQKFCNDEYSVVKFNIRQLLSFMSKFDACKLLVAHNHPNGDPTPSAMDISNNQIIFSYCASLQVEYIDHIIVGKSKLYSFKNCRIFDKTTH